MNGTFYFERPVYVSGWGSCGGPKEAQGPLARGFDVLWDDSRRKNQSWEKAEREMKLTACRAALYRAQTGNAGLFIAGDLLNQCITAGYSARELGFPFLGLYGACSTMAESMMIGAAMISGGWEEKVLCSASSHFCTAERQYRYPLEYGGQRPPTAQWTATAAGAVVLSDKRGSVRLQAAKAGTVADGGIKDASNMGAAMALSAYDTLSRWFSETGKGPDGYDLIVTGDLGAVGKSMLTELFAADGVDMAPVYEDCGLMLYHAGQDVHSGASGCGCSAAVLCASILPALDKGLYRSVLFCGTGALFSPVSNSQGDTIPGICHLIELEAV